MEVINSCPKSTTEQNDELNFLAVLLYISSQIGNTICQRSLKSPSLCPVDHNGTQCIDDQQCNFVRDTVCAIEWRLAENVFNFSEPSFSCCDSNDQPESTPPLNCTNEFVLVCDSICIISCEKFSQHPDSVTKAYTRLFIFTGHSLMIGATIVIILSVIKHKTMYVSSSRPIQFPVVANIAISYH